MKWLRLGLRSRAPLNFARRQSVARVLVDSVAGWASSEGCMELASDSLLDNTAAHEMHRALGFEETERVVYFRRVLRDA
jgi:aminoglycoside 6'-N-acetyltransferase I